jgi:hypothetical protein
MINRIIRIARFLFLLISIVGFNATNAQTGGEKLTWEIGLSDSSYYEFALAY